MYIIVVARVKISGKFGCFSAWKPWNKSVLWLSYFGEYPECVLWLMCSAHYWECCLMQAAQPGAEGKQGLLLLTGQGLLSSAGRFHLLWQEISSGSRITPSALCCWSPDSPAALLKSEMCHCLPEAQQVFALDASKAWMQCHTRILASVFNFFEIKIISSSVIFCLSRIH